MAEWLREFFYTPDGRAFDEFSVPWVTAPQGPCWAYDNPQFNLFWLQWAARMFKTNFGLSTMMRRMHLDPCDLMFATPDETNCKQVFGRWWRMICNCPALRDEAPIPRWQAKTHIELARSRCYGGWPRGKSRLADKSLPAGVANEVDKWEHLSTSTEGDPLPRFLKRGAEYPDRKFVIESTPGTRGRSRVESGRLQSTNHAWHVPCPHCGKYQTLEFGNGTEPGGIHWDKLPNGASDRDLARRTAHYVCRHCEGRVDDMHRPQMEGLGVWVPFGCEVDHERAMVARELPPDDTSWLRGEQAHGGNHYGSHISVFHALFHGFGNMAEEFLQKKARVQDLRQWTNEDKGETWEYISRQQTWETLGSRIVVEVPRGRVPAEHSVVTIGVDKQEGYYVYTVCSWGAKQSGHVVEYGIAQDVNVLHDLIRTKWQREGGEMLKPLATMVDSGYRPADVHRFVMDAVASGLPVRACRGSNTRLAGYYQNKQNTSRASAPGQWVTWVDTHSTQDWLDECLNSRTPLDAGGLSLFADSLAEHQDFLEQMLNDALVSDLDTANLVRERWQRIDPMVPNDYRDCVRYAFVGLMLVARRVPQRTGQRQQKQPEAPPHLLQRPGGWLQGVT